LPESEAHFFRGLVKPSDLSAVFQPIVALDGGELLAYEALVRCRIPELSPPELFARAAADRSTGRLGRMIREIAVPLCSGTPLFVKLSATSSAPLSWPRASRRATSTWRFAIAERNTDRAISLLTQAFRCPM